jgi:MFS family permease
VAILTLASVVSSVDRGVLNLVVDPVRRDLQISDLQVGVLQGAAFSLVYAFVGVPLGMLADRVRRISLLSAGIALWSVATVLGGLAPSFGWMMVSRIFVGVGEATLAPCAVSLISDQFPPNRRGGPIGVQMMGSASAAGIGIALVGLIFGLAQTRLFRSLPVAGHLASWRVVFCICGAAGLLVSLLLLTRQEPRRRERAAESWAGLKAGGILAHLRANGRVYLPLYAAFALFTVAAWALNSWTPAYLMRAYRLSPSHVAAVLGAPSVIAGAAGAILGGQLLDRQGRLWTARGQALLLVALPLCAAPAAMAVFAPNLYLAIALLLAMTMLFPMATTVALNLIVALSPNETRATCVALLGFASSSLGAVAGPLMVGLATERLFLDPDRVGYSLLLVAGPALLLSAAGFLIAARGLRGVSAPRSGRSPPLAPVP